MYTGAWDDACGAQLSQGHDGQKLLVVFLSHTLVDTWQKQSTTEQEAYGVDYAVTNRNCYLQGSDIVVCNHKPPQKVLNDEMQNSKQMVTGTCYL